MQDMVPAPAKPASASGVAETPGDYCRKWASTLLRYFFMCTNKFSKIMGLR